MSYEVEKTDEQWQAELTPSEYQVLRLAGTEPAFRGEYTDTKTVGVYRCRACGAADAAVLLDLGELPLANAFVGPDDPDADRPDAPQSPVGSFCWNELWTPDEQTALAFYEKVFGYTHDTMDMGEQGTYYMLRRDGVARAGLMRSVEPKAPPMWLPYVAVADCDASADKARSLGGQVVYAPHDIPNVGRFSVLVDPLGAAVAIIKLAPMAA